MKTITTFFSWIFYFLITQEERHLYSMGKIKGSNCIGYKDVSKTLPGSTRVYTYERNQAPVRNYLTWDEFWKRS